MTIILFAALFDVWFHKFSYLSCSAAGHRDESRCGTHECVRYDLLLVEDNFHFHVVLTVD
jgi:hypothetical protein